MVKSWKIKHKLKSQKLLHLKRKSNLRDEIINKSGNHLSKIIKCLKSRFVGIEAELVRDTKDTKKALAKAISSMPDNISLIARSILAVNLAENLQTKLVLVRKEGTSRFHNNCGGVIEKNDDTGKCKKCGKILIHHANAARNITELACKIVDLYTQSLE